MTGETERFPVVRISRVADALLAEYTSAVFGHATTQGSRKVEEDAYAHLCVTKKSLATFISALEELHGHVREVTLRF